MSIRFITKYPVAATSFYYFLTDLKETLKIKTFSIFSPIISHFHRGNLFYDDLTAIKNF